MIRDFNQEWRAAKTPQERWPIIRRAYSYMLPHILQHRCDPYVLDWSPTFTPIEMWAWTDIRAAGLPFYPQFPALHYFLDFADPVLQIAVELDGAAYHNAERDRARDQALWEQGWRVFRIPGGRSVPMRATIQDALQDLSTSDPRGRRHTVLEWGKKHSEGFFWALGIFYYGRKCGLDFPIHAARDVSEEILEFHRLIEFPIMLNEEDDLE